MPSIARLLLALLTLFAIGLQWSIHVRLSYPSLNFFSYFTNLANLFAAMVLLIGLRARPDRVDVARFASTVNMAVVGVVFALLLRNVDLGSLRPWINVLLHYVMPVAIVLDWLLDPPTRPLRVHQRAWVLVFPAAYVIYTLVRGAVTGWYPYPFLDPAKAGGATGVALHVIGITIAFVLASALLWAIGNRQRAARNRRAART